MYTTISKKSLISYGACPSNISETGKTVYKLNYNCNYFRDAKLRVVVQTFFFVLELQSKSHCKIIQEELANVDEQTIKLTDVSSLSGSDSNSSNEGRTSAIVCCVSSANETNFSDISVKAEILDENHLNTSKISPATAAVTQGSTGFEKRVSDSWNERKRVECCSCFHTENCHGLNSKFNSLLEAILAKQLQSDSSNNKTTMTAYEKARLQLERDKYALQEKTAKCLRDISKEIRQIRASFSRVKRRRTNGHNAISHKRQRWRCESDSSV